MEIRCTFSCCTSVNKVALWIPLRFLSRRYYHIKTHNHYHTASALSVSSSTLKVFLSCNMHCFPSFHNTADQFKWVICGIHEWGITVIVPRWKEAPTYSFQRSVSGNINLGWVMFLRIKHSDSLSATRWLRKQLQTRACNHSQILEGVCRVSG